MGGFRSISRRFFLRVKRSKFFFFYLGREGFVCIRFLDWVVVFVFFVGRSVEFRFVVFIIAGAIFLT